MFKENQFSFTSTPTTTNNQTSLSNQILYTSVEKSSQMSQSLPLSPFVSPPRLHHILKLTNPPSCQITRTLQKVAWLNDFVVVAFGSSPPPTIMHTRQLVTPQPPGIHTLSPHCFFNPSYLHFLAIVSMIYEPTSYYHAKSGPEWVVVMEKTLSALEENGIQQLISLAPNKKVITSKWIYKVKFNLDSTIDCYKARLVTKGYNQLLGLDYTASFSPVAKPVTVRILFALASA